MNKIKKLICFVINKNSFKSFEWNTSLSYADGVGLDVNKISTLDNCVRLGIKNTNKNKCWLKWKNNLPIYASLKAKGRTKTIENKNFKTTYPL